MSQLTNGTVNGNGMRWVSADRFASASTRRMASLAHSRAAGELRSRSTWQTLEPSPPDDTSRRTNRHRIRRHITGDDGVRADDGARANDDAAGHDRADAEPDIVADAHSRFGNSLVLDWPVDPLMPMVEVRDVDVVGEQCRFADLDVEVAVDRVPPAEHRVITDPEGAFVTPYCRASADVH